MTQPLSTELVWKELKKEIFAVLGMVTAQGEARTVGIVYVVHEGRLYLTSRAKAWKVRHIRRNPNVSLTVPIHKQIPFLPWVKIPAATITFAGRACVHPPDRIGPELAKVLFRGLVLDEEMKTETSVIEIEPVGEFVTYGVCMPLMDMRDPTKARGRARVA
jgi:hypothetical protein